MLLLSLLTPSADGEERLRPIITRHAGGMVKIEDRCWRLERTPIDREALLRDMLATVRESGLVPALCHSGFTPQVAAFDLDSTLIPCELVDRLAECRGVGELTRHLTCEAMEGRMDFSASYTQRIALLKGMTLKEVDRVIDALPLTPGAEELFRVLKEQAVSTVLLTGGYRRAGEAVRRRLGLDALYATDLEELNGCLTGRALPPLVDEQGKAAALEAFCRLNGTSPSRALAVGDGANDLKMLATAGCAVLYRAATEAGSPPIDCLLSLFQPRNAGRYDKKLAQI